MSPEIEFCLDTGLLLDHLVLEFLVKNGGDYVDVRIPDELVSRDVVKSLVYPDARRAVRQLLRRRPRFYTVPGVWVEVHYRSRNIPRFNTRVFWDVARRVNKELQLEEHLIRLDMADPKAIGLIGLVDEQLLHLARTKKVPLLSIERPIKTRAAVLSVEVVHPTELIGRFSF